jgi:DNA-binding MarR family transcriptional regulator
MNYSSSELSPLQDTDAALIEASVQLLPLIGAALYAAIAELGQTYHLTPTQVKALLQFSAHQQLTVGELAGALAISMPAASELVDRLVDAGHLARTEDPHDRRRVLVAATPESAQIGERLHELRVAQMRSALDRLAPRERPIFVKSLEALAAGLTHSADATACAHIARPARSGRP